MGEVRRISGDVTLPETPGSGVAGDRPPFPTRSTLGRDVAIQVIESVLEIRRRVNGR